MNSNLRTRLCLVCLALCRLSNSYADEIGHTTSSFPEGLKQPADVSWHLTGHNSGSDFRLIKKSTSTRDTNGIRVDRYAFSKSSDNAELFNSDINEIVVFHDKAGEIVTIQVLVDAQGSLGLDKHVKNSAVEDSLRTSVLLFLVASGEIKWKTTVANEVSISTVLPDCDFQVGVAGGKDKDILTLGRSFTTRNIDAHQLGDGVAYFESPDTRNQGCYVWICGDINNPIGAVMTRGWPIDRFGHEFEGVIDWTRIVNASTNRMQDSTLSLLDRLMTTITPPASSLHLDVDEEMYRNDDWIWSVKVGDDLNALSELGTLRMTAAKLSRQEFREWKERTFAFTPLDNGTAKFGSLTQLLPETIVCHRNSSSQISCIEANYKSLSFSDLNHNKIDSLVFNLVGLLLSTGALDSSFPSIKMASGKLPVGTQPVAVANNAVVKLIPGKNMGGVSTYSLSDTGLVKNNALNIEWSRTLAIDNELREGFAGQLEGNSDRYSVKLVFSRFGIKMTPDSLFRTPHVASFGLESSIDGWKTKNASHLVWCMRTKPRPDYFLCLMEQERQVMLAQLENQRGDSRTSANAPELSRLPQLLSWLTVEDAGIVLRSLVKIQRAKLLWAQSAGAESTHKVTWDDIAPFLETPRDQLPKPCNGQYILGNDLSSAPDYRPKASDRIQPIK